MKIPRLTAADFEAVCVRISMGQEIELAELLGAKRYTDNTTCERYQLLQALLVGYCVLQTYRKDGDAPCVQ